MSRFSVGDKAKVNDRPGWPGGYKIAGWTGDILEVKDDPKGYVVMQADETGYRMAFPENELQRL